MADAGSITIWSLLLLVLLIPVEEDEVSDDDEFTGISSSCRVMFPSEESTIHAEVHPHSPDRLAFCKKGAIPIEPISLSLSPKRLRWDENDATDPLQPAVKDACLLKFMDPPPLNEEVFMEGFRVIFSLKERRGLRTASTAVLLTQTLVPLPSLLLSGLIVELLLLLVLIFVGKGDK